jgi:hypothetical protein
MKQPPESQNFDQIAHAIGETLSTLINDHNFQLPIFALALAANANLCFFRYTAGAEHLECEVLSQHIEDSGGFRLPIRLIFLDGASGEAAMLFVERGKPTTLQLQ